MTRSPKSRLVALVEVALIGLVAALAAPAFAQIDLQGHRGARGLLPENTIPSVIAALDHGVDTIELDVVVSSDEMVVVSHEPWMSSAICRTPDGRNVTEEDEHAFNIYTMTYAEAAAFDCGARGHADFPQQRPRASAKPLLREVILISDGYAQRTGRTLPNYNIEIKSRPDGDGTYHPEPEDFVRLVYDILKDEDVLERSNVQSFDLRPLRVLRELDPSIRLALLVGNEDGYGANIDRLGFLPEIYSPNFGLVDSALVAAAHSDGLLLIPWTVNERAEMDALLRLGVDGLITDYPDIGREAIDAHLRAMRDG